MTKLGVIADQTFLNPIFIPLGGPQAHERSGRDDKFMEWLEADDQASLNDFRQGAEALLPPHEMRRLPAKHWPFPQLV
jgi:hypothetical protein